MFMLSVVYAEGRLSSVSFMLSVTKTIMLSVIMLNVIMLSVVAPTPSPQFVL